MERNKGVKRRFKSQAKQIFRSCLYELTKRPRVRRKEIRDRGKKERIGCRVQVYKEKCKKKKKMETRWKSERSKIQFCSNYIRVRIKVCKLVLKSDSMMNKFFFAVLI